MSNRLCAPLSLARLRRVGELPAPSGILVATDLAGNFEQAIHRAGLLAQQLGCPLTVLHVIDEALPSHIAAQMAAGARETLWSSVRGIAGAAGHRVEIVVKRGEAARSIVNEARTRNCRLIILGQHRMAAAGQLHCCTTEQVICASDLPVLVVRNNPDGQYRHLLAAIDLARDPAAVVRSALLMAPKADLQCLYAYSPSALMFWARKRLSEQLISAARRSFADMLQHELASDISCIGRRPETIGCIVRRGGALEAIDEEVRVRGSELLVLGVPNDAAGAALGAVSMAFLNCPPCDVLFQPIGTPARAHMATAPDEA